MGFGAQCPRQAGRGVASPTALLGRPKSRQLFRSIPAPRPIIGVRHESTAGNALKGQWSVRSPKQLYEHLSQYIIGQERAKRVLSVACVSAPSVFNHYLRITPTPPTEPLSQAPVPDLPPPAMPPTNSRSPPTRRRDTYHNLSPDPSRAGASLDDGVRRDATRAVGGDGEGADPTLTHALLNSRSREGQWARDGFFSANAPSSSSPSSPRRRRQPLGEPDDAFTHRSQEVNEEARRAIRSRDDESPIRQAPRRAIDQQRHAEELRAKAELDEGLIGKPKGKAKEEVLVEKSNVLMVGPTGTGKTLMAKTLARVLDVPFASCDATTYTQAGYVGEDVENCVLRLLQNAEYDVGRTEVGIIHIDEIDKLARRGGSDFGSWGGGRDVGGEGVQQALLRLLEGTTLTLTAKAPAVTSAPSSPPLGGGSTTLGGLGGATGKDTPKAEAAFGNPPEWDPNNPMNRTFGAAGSGKKGVREGLPGFGGGSGGTSSGKGETFVIDTSNILFVLSGAFVGLESIVNRRLGKGSIGFGAPLPLPPTAPDTTAEISPTPLKGLTTADLATYGLIPEFLGRLPVLSTLHPLSTEDLVRILTEPRNALIKQYQASFEKMGSDLQFTDGAIREIAKTGLERGGGARGLRGIMEEVLLDSMFDVPDSSIRYLIITESVVKGDEPAHYFSRGQRVLFLNMLEEENAKTRSAVVEDLAEGDGEMGVDVEEEERLRSSG